MTAEDLPFDEAGTGDGPNYITEAMVRKATYLIHKLADRRGADYPDIQKKCKKLLGYANLAKVSLDEGHKIINKLIELTGGEEEEDPKEDTHTNEGAKITDDGSHAKEVEDVGIGESVQVAFKDDLVTGTMREAIRAAVDITLKEVVEKDVPVQGLGGFVLEIGKVIFDARMKEEQEK